MGVFTKTFSSLVHEQPLSFKQDLWAPWLLLQHLWSFKLSDYSSSIPFTCSPFSICPLHDGLREIFVLPSSYSIRLLSCLQVPGIHRLKSPQKNSAGLVLKGEHILDPFWPGHFFIRAHSRFHGEASHSSHKSSNKCISVCHSLLSSWSPSW